MAPTTRANKRKADEAQQDLASYNLRSGKRPRYIPAGPAHHGPPPPPPQISQPAPQPLIPSPTQAVVAPTTQPASINDPANIQKQAFFEKYGQNLPILKNLLQIPSIHDVLFALKRRYLCLERLTKDMAQMWHYVDLWNKVQDPLRQLDATRELLEHAVEEADASGVVADFPAHWKGEEWREWRPEHPEQITVEPIQVELGVFDQLRQREQHKAKRYHQNLLELVKERNNARAADIIEENMNPGPPDAERATYQIRIETEQAFNRMLEEARRDGFTVNDNGIMSLVRDFDFGPSYSLTDKLAAIARSKSYGVKRKYIDAWVDGDCSGIDLLVVAPGETPSDWDRPYTADSLLYNVFDSMPMTRMAEGARRKLINHRKREEGSLVIGDNGATAVVGVQDGLPKCKCIICISHLEFLSTRPRVGREGEDLRSDYHTNLSLGTGSLDTRWNM